MAATAATTWILTRLRRQRGRQHKPPSARFSRRYSGRFPVFLSLALGLTLVPSVHPFAFGSAPSTSTPPPPRNVDCGKSNGAADTRREAFSRAATTAAAWCVLTGVVLPPPASAAPEDDVREARALLLEAKAQLERVPPLLQEEKWDGVRTALMEAPLRDCWSKASPVPQRYAEALGETPAGDELAALEGREELLQHLRFLDMAVYDNVFNPIATMGEASASKALIDCYYNDPKREYAASKKAIDDLLQLSE